MTVIVVNHEEAALAMRRRGNPHPQPTNPEAPPPPR